MVALSLAMMLFVTREAGRLFRDHAEAGRVVIAPVINAARVANKARWSECYCSADRSSRSDPSLVSG